MNSRRNTGKVARQRLKTETQALFVGAIPFVAAHLHDFLATAYEFAPKNRQSRPTATQDRNASIVCRGNSSMTAHLHHFLATAYEFATNNRQSRPARTENRVQLEGEAPSSPLFV